MKKITKEKVKAFFNSPEAQDLKILIAFGIDKTPTDVDDNIVSEAGDYSEIIAEFLESVDELEPTGKDALGAAMRSAKKIASLTKTPWDDRIFNAIDWVI
jgi:hypothetical protein